jgi:hypothetical protein
MLYAPEEFGSCAAPGDSWSMQKLVPLDRLSVRRRDGAWEYATLTSRERRVQLREPDYRHHQLLFRREMTCEST